MSEPNYMEWIKEDLIEQILHFRDKAECANGIIRKTSEDIGELRKEFASALAQKDEELARASKSRECLLSYFAFLIGGWNASKGTSPGRLRFEDNYNDDEAITRLLLDRHKSDISGPLNEEIKKLKAKLYDTEGRLTACKEGRKA